jgi:ankyrin repeat protein
MSEISTSETGLDRLKKEAKRWLRAIRAGDEKARARLTRATPNAPASPTLRDVQHAIARELGFPGWIALKRQLEVVPPPPGTPDALANRFLEAACPDHHVRGLPDHERARHTAMRLLERHPEIAHHSFHTAVVCGDLVAVQRALAARPELATERSPGMSPSRAMAGNSGDVFHELGAKGWDPLLYLCFTRLPLDAVTTNAVAIARLLLDRGADPNVYFQAGGSSYTPLVGAIGEGEEHRPPHQQRDALVRLLLDRGAEPYDIQVMYNMGFNADYLWYLPLIYERSVQLGRKADWDDPEWSMLSMGNYGTGSRWLLGHAIGKNDLALVEWCLRHGASPNSAPAKDPRFHQTSLYEQAIQLGHHEVAELLVRYGAERTRVARSPLEDFVADCLRLDRESVRRQLERHPEYLRSHQALFAAAARDRADVVEFLLDLGMSPDVENEQHERALHVASYNNAVAVARVLIARGAEIDPVERNYGNTPLGGAVWGLHREIIELLVPRSRDVWELTYLGKVDRLRELFDEKPERARVVWQEWTPLMWLPPDDERLALEIVKLFLEYGADPAARNKEGMTAADRAEKLGMVDVAEYLRQRMRERGGSDTGPQ